MEGNIIFYTTDCPKCAILQKKLDAAHLSYQICDDVTEMQALGLLEAPALGVGGEVLRFPDAVRFVNEYVSERMPSG